MKHDLGIDLNKNAQAIISDDGFYRYWLHRTWLSGRGFITWLMLNPSTADGLIDDPTIRKCVTFSQNMHYNGMIVVNLFAARATKPKALYGMKDAVGPECDRYIDLAATISSTVICAWGAQGIAEVRGTRVARRLRRNNIHLLCLGRNVQGKPRHPLFLPFDTLVEKYG